MKIFKISDAFIQLALIIFFTVKVIVRRTDTADMPFLGYYVVGSYQVLSCLVHLLLRFNRQNYARLLYEYLLAGLLIFCAISMLLRSGGFLWVLFLGSPFLAIFYTSLSIRETYKLFDYEK